MYYKEQSTFCVLGELIGTATSEKDGLLDKVLYKTIPKPVNVSRSKAVKFTYFIRGAILVSVARNSIAGFAELFLLSSNSTAPTVYRFNNTESPTVVYGRLVDNTFEVVFSNLGDWAGVTYIAFSGDNLTAEEIDALTSYDGYTKLA